MESKTKKGIETKVIVIDPKSYDIDKLGYKGEILKAEKYKRFIELKFNNEPIPIIVWAGDYLEVL